MLQHDEEVIKLFRAAAEHLRQLGLQQVLPDNRMMGICTEMENFAHEHLGYKKWYEATTKQNEMEDLLHDEMLRFFNGGQAPDLPIPYPIKHPTEKPGHAFQLDNLWEPDAYLLGRHANFNDATYIMRRLATCLELSKFYKQLANIWEQNS